MRFKDFYKNYKEITPVLKRKTEEELFEDVTGVSVPSMKSFVAWLVLHEHIPAFIKEKKSGKPIPIMKIPESKKILFLTKTLSNIKELAEEFASKFKKKDYLCE